MSKRMIKDSIRTSESVNSLDDFEFRLWVGLITFVDDFGRGSANSKIIKGFVFPLRDCVTPTDIQVALSGLVAKGMIKIYEADGDSFFYFPKWEKHQRMQNKYSQYPEPPQEDNVP